MLIIGLTGSIGMGKTTASQDFRRLGVPVHSADEVVHELMNVGGCAVSLVAAAFPGTDEFGAINRTVLGHIVFNDPQQRHKLEKILHPLVVKHRDRFLMFASRRRAKMVVLDVPLLFETSGDVNCDVVVTVSAPAFIQRQRVLARPRMDRDRFDKILASQITDLEKCRRSDFIVQTGLGRLESFRKIRMIVSRLSSWPSKQWPPKMHIRRRAKNRLNGMNIKKHA